MDNIIVPAERIEGHFDELAKIGNLGPRREDGYLRASWSDEESAAMTYIGAVGRSAGMIATYDGVGNLFVRTPQRRAQVVQTGSHLDTVPKGGLYDGGAGVVAGLEAIIALKPYWDALERGLELVVWRGEESATFGVMCKGSQAAFGLLDPETLKREYRGKTLQEAIYYQRFAPGSIEERKPTLSQEKIDSIAAHLELHIEQANRLEREGMDIGIVTGIRGTARLRVDVTGEARHAGGTPMGTAFRKDANLAMAYMQVELDRLGQDYMEQGEDLVQTVGVINADRDLNQRDGRVYDNALTKISPFGYFTLDIRSTSSAFLGAYKKQVRDLIGKVGACYRVEVKITEFSALSPVEAMDFRLQASVEAACQEMGLKYLYMPSGALHDVSVVSEQRRSDGTAIPTGLIFVPCEDGVSHNPLEYASPEAIGKGAMVLARAMLKAGRR